MQSSVEVRLNSKTVGSGDLAKVLHMVFPPEDTVGLASAQDMRTAFRALIEYHTLCCFDCFSHLQAKHLLLGPDIMILFPTAKSDPTLQRPAVVSCCHSSAGSLSGANHEVVLSQIYFFPSVVMQMIALS